MQRRHAPSFLHTKTTGGLQAPNAGSINPVGQSPPLADRSPPVSANSFNAVSVGWVERLTSWGCHAPSERYGSFPGRSCGKHQHTEASSVLLIWRWVCPTLWLGYPIAGVSPPATYFVRASIAKSTSSRLVNLIDCSNTSQRVCTLEGCLALTLPLPSVW